ncbi:hypothetical protein FB451DRAFT_1173107 [Mycena latifolia]|nr:hypothetical protein FB451DRAFT_1173107 [Mycena latifolia]
MSTSRSVAPNALANATNLPAAPPDVLVAMRDELAKAQAKVETFKQLVMGLTKKSKCPRKRKARWCCLTLLLWDALADVAASSVNDDVENEAPFCNRAKTTQGPEHQVFFGHGRTIMRFIGPFETSSP